MSSKFSNVCFVLLGEQKYYFNFTLLAISISAILIRSRSWEIGLAQIIFANIQKYVGDS